LPPRQGDASPWGIIDNVSPLGPEAVSVTTPSHGGIWVTPDALAKIPDPLRVTAYSGGGWFEEDCDWCIPYLALGLHRFEERSERGAQNLAAARKTLWLCHKDVAGLLDHAGDDRGRTVDSFPSRPPLSSPAAASVQEASPARTFQSLRIDDRLGALRRRVRDQGTGSLQETEALELLLGRCCQSAATASAVAAALLGRFGSIPRIVGATIPELSLIAGDEVAVELALFHDLARQILEFPLHKRSVLSSWSAVLAYLKLNLAGRSREAFHVLFLDKANQLIADERMGDGTIDHAPVYPREIMRRALELAASACCLVHNHPTGSSTPSAADIEMTRRVIEAGKALGVAIHDHFLVAGDHVVSFKALGLM
ncbi:MAG TPA: DNA repair protein RadC, partial [Caulobacteraceae bacterium]|nr:DNA repair protein RadC [Caulobacteraceae bacterium]